MCFMSTCLSFLFSLPHSLTLISQSKNTQINLKRKPIGNINLDTPLARMRRSKKIYTYCYSSLLSQVSGAASFKLDTLNEKKQSLRTCLQKDLVNLKPPYFRTTGEGNSTSIQQTLQMFLVCTSSKTVTHSRNS